MSLFGILPKDFFQREETSFCLWKNASTLDMIAFKYVTIMNALIWFMNRCGG